MSTVKGSHRAERRLEELGIQLPSPPTPLGAYAETVQTGRLLFLSGTLPVEGGVFRHLGRIGQELNLDEGRRATRLAALNAVALARARLGSLDRVTRVVTLRVYLAVHPDFLEHAKVADGASELLLSVFGADNLPTRMVLGVPSLPAGASAALELVLETDVGAA